MAVKKFDRKWINLSYVLHMKYPSKKTQAEINSFGRSYLATVSNIFNMIRASGSRVISSHEHGKINIVVNQKYIKYRSTPKGIKFNLTRKKIGINEYVFTVSLLPALSLNGFMALRHVTAGTNVMVSDIYDVPSKYGVRVRHELSTEKGEPTDTFYEGLYCIKYKIKDRIEQAKHDDVLDKLLKETGEEVMEKYKEWLRKR